ncbi:glycoside hydrolase family 26 protein [Dysgonomonas sp. ZJ709]|uniref:glycoside hydrolase family 26 protein n=1 Tax=Dysgonomonas sp. ZJ709 TaxID=2709797 RepID=UPI0013EA8B88|nr:glycosyl hydrolase [Dysgonomonas sp. ZJ709]
MKNVCLFILLFCLPILSIKASGIVLVDKQATAETYALFCNLKKLQTEGKVAFGHQDATLYGRTWVGDKDRSDIKDVVGDHPALLGLDFEAVTNTTSPNYPAIENKLVTAVKDFYRKGGIITFAWHARNPANNGSFYWEKDPIKVVSDILPGGKYHDKYKEYLKAIADISSKFRGDNGELIPVIFRPYHEFDGDWFWWGKNHCTKDEFVSLWKFTVDYLKGDLKVHNFLYAFSPDCKFSTEAEFLDYYPGDDYVDIVGMDNYWDFRPDGANNPALAEVKLQIVSDVAIKRNKIAALTETGLEGIPDATWFTQTLLPILQRVKVAYALVWRNASDSPTHYYAPTIGHPAEDDFRKFYEEPNILFQSKLPNMYKCK